MLGSTALMNAAPASASRDAGKMHAQPVARRRFRLAMHGLLLPAQQLRGIEMRGRALQVVHLECGGHFLEREQFVSWRGMAEAEQVVGHRLRQVALLAQLPQRQRTVALRKRRAIRAVSKARWP